MKPIDKFDNYEQPINYVAIEMPDDEICRKIRFAGVPYENCKCYSIAFKVNANNEVGNVIKGWPGYAYECPIIPTWDSEGPWSILQTEILT